LDLHAGNLLRLSPHQKSRKLYKYQHLYAWMVYGISTLAWITIKDVKDLFSYRKKGFRFNKQNSFSRELVKLLLSKSLYYGYIFVIPTLVLPIVWWQVLIGIVVLHFVAGVILSITFQLAHVVEEIGYPQPDDDGNVESDWAVHQLQTTANFANKSRILNWYMGGLNFQIEHHLFPKVCHIHHRNISKIVKQTVVEFQLPYNEYKTLPNAVFSHYKMLKGLGQPCLA
jgi:linoleoyl-CoA desaturase